MSQKKKCIERRCKFNDIRKKISNSHATKKGGSIANILIWACTTDMGHEKEEGGILILLQFLL